MYKNTTSISCKQTELLFHTHAEPFKLDYFTGIAVTLSITRNLLQHLYTLLVTKFISWYFIHVLSVHFPDIFPKQFPFGFSMGGGGPHQLTEIIIIFIISSTWPMHS